MRKEVRDIISSMTTYEKQELVTVLTEEIHNNHNAMINHLNNIDGHVFGIMLNSEHNNLNELTMTQLGRIKKLSQLVEENS